MDSTLKSKIERVDVVSFDVFDTSILRALARPEDLFALMEPAVHRLLGTPPAGFAAARRAAEQQARDHAWQKERVREVTLGEIYDALAKSVALDPEQVQALVEMEITAELDICRRNPFIHGIYRWCLDRGKRIAFISDTYLPEKVIEELLHRSGYERYELLLASSTSKKTKSTGALHAEARERIASKRGWLHIGDNLRSDIKMARRHGMSTWYYRRCMDAYMDARHVARAWQSAEPPSPATSVAQGLVANRVAQSGRRAVAEDKGFWEEFGYATVGPLFVGFTEWLIDEARRRRLDALYFLAREGRIMQLVYDKLAGAADTAVRETHYLYGSRRALNIAAIHKLDDDHIAFLSSGISMLTAAQFVERAGIDWRAHPDAFKAAGFDSPHQDVRTGADYACLRRLFAELEGPICANAQQERDVLLDYLRASGLTAGRKVGLVDVGWHGTMQRSLTNMLRDAGDCPDIVGLYLGTHAFAPKLGLIDESYPHDGYLFRGGEPDSYRRLVWEGVEVVELLFAATEGTIVRVERERDGEFRPVRAATDCEPYRVDSVRRMQSGAMEFVDDYLALKSRFPELKLTRDAAVAELKRLLRHPSAAEARHIGDIPHGEGFGSVYARRLLAIPHSLRLLARPKDFRSLLRNDYWHAGRNRRGSPVQRAVYWLLTR